MCGIVGFRCAEGFEGLRASLPLAVSRLQHRGPDDSGMVSDPAAGVAFGHRRLAVIDLSAAARQPMASADGRLWVTYNGEIYNYSQLRDELRRLGHVFHTASDTEVILGAYRQWGIDCLKRFVGMFALALWDVDTQRLYLARDRLGIKPLYYYQRGSTLMFASELKALRALNGFPARIDNEALLLFLHYQYVPTPRSIFEDTAKLAPGCYAVFDGSQLACRPYWQLPYLESGQKVESFSESDALNELDKRLSQAVGDRLVSDVPLGALLSGGIDSSMVVAMMQRLSSRPVKTFSIGFLDKDHDEAPFAAAIARRLGTDHTELYVTAQMALGVISSLGSIYDEPFADSSAIPTLLVTRLARSQVTVALSGDGGDEQFCGYVRYWSVRAMAEAFERLPLSVRKAGARLLEAIPCSWAQACYAPWRRHLPQQFQVANFQDKWQKLIQLLAETSLQELYRTTICLWPETELFRLSGQELPPSRFEQAFAQSAALPLLSRLMHVDQLTYLPDGMLTKVDRASMAWGLEMRVPLLDHRVVEFSAGLPESLKYRNGNGKYLLKKLLARYLPPKLFARPKTGFGIPLADWLRKELRELLCDYLSPERLKAEGRFDPNYVQQKIQEHMSGKAGHHYRLWALLMWQMWRESWNQ